MSEGIQFDRRRSDANYGALAVRVSALEEQMEVVKLDLGHARREIQANTALTEELHGQGAEMYEAFTMGKNAVRVVTAAGNGAMWVAEKGRKLAIFALLCGGVWILATTGKVPEWLLKVLG